MKKTLTKISYITGILVLLLLAAVILYFFKFRSETQKMSPCPTQQLADGLYSINDTFVNMYLVQDGDNYIAIDAGNDSAAIVKGFRQLHIDPAKVTAVLLTHTDRDHVAALNLFKNAELRFAKEEEQMINGKTARAMGMNFGVEATHSICGSHDIVFCNRCIEYAFMAKLLLQALCHIKHAPLILVGHILPPKEGVGIVSEFAF